MLNRANQDTHTTIISYKLIGVHDATYAVCLCEDYKLKLWNLKTNDLIIEDLFKIKNRMIETTSWG
jgi:hypothetical protein